MSDTNTSTRNSTELLQLNMPLASAFGMADPSNVAAGLLIARQHQGLVHHQWRHTNGTINDDLWVTARGFGDVVVDNFDHNDKERCVVVDDPDGVWMLHVRGGGGHVYVSCVAREADIAGDFVTRLCELVGDDTSGDTGSVATRFCNAGNPVTWRSREIVCPTWDDISENYTGSGGDALATLAAGVEPAGGRIILLWGSPGTGKTTAVRALMREWAPWCESICVLDPENMLASPDYLHAVAVGDTPDFEDEDEPQKWRLVICEDLDTVLHADAAGRSGATLGRLLNITDGIAGQGLRTLLLITTNEPVSNLHPALTRPGRCLAQVELGQFEPNDATRWLRQHSPDHGGTTKPMSLADMWADIADRPVVAANVEPARHGTYL